MLSGKHHHGIKTFVLGAIAIALLLNPATAGHLVSEIGNTFTSVAGGLFA